MNLDDELNQFIEYQEIPIFGIANSEGFARALPRWHPKELMPKCESVIVFGRPYIDHPFEIDEKTHVADESWWEANQIVYDQIADCKGKLVGIFDNFGLGSASFGGFWLAEAPTFSYRLAQVEAGLGIYGRTGVCLNPEYGCYYHVGVLLVEAKLTPTNRQYQDDFSPCMGCSECAKVCPVRAIDESIDPGAGYDQELCVRFSLKVNEKRGREDKLCARCFSACPWSLGKLGGTRTQVL